jgi:hypothetical protein
VAHAVNGVRSRFIDDARGYAYWYARNLGTLFTVEGVNLTAR